MGGFGGLYLGTLKGQLDTLCWSPWACLGPQHTLKDPASPKGLPNPSVTPSCALPTPRSSPWKGTAGDSRDTHRAPQASWWRRWAASRSRPRYSRRRCSPAGTEPSPPRSPQQPAAMVPVESLSPPCSTALAHSSSQLPPAASSASRATMGASWPLRPGHPSNAQLRYSVSRSAGDGRDGTRGGPRPSRSPRESRYLQRHGGIEVIGDIGVTT